MYAATRISAAYSRMITLIYRTTTVDTINGRGSDRRRQTRARARGLTRADTSFRSRSCMCMVTHWTCLQFSERFCNSCIPPGGYLITYAPRPVITFALSRYGASKWPGFRMTADAAICVEACQRTAMQFFPRLITDLYSSSTMSELYIWQEQAIAEMLLINNYKWDTRDFGEPHGSIVLQALMEAEKSGVVKSKLSFFIDFWIYLSLIIPVKKQFFSIKTHLLLDSTLNIM